MRTIQGLFLLTSLLVLTGCASGGPSSVLYPRPGGRTADEGVSRDDGHRHGRGRGRGHAHGHHKKARKLSVPPGHYPPAGHCRVWFPGRPPGHQPAPTRCDGLVGRVPYGAVVLYNGKYWDTHDDWDKHHKDRSAPRPILSIMLSIRP